jgi:opacity protein-like surface antigen
MASMQTFRLPRWLLPCFAVMSLGGGSLSHADAQGPTDETRSTWRIAFTPYFWALAVDGEIDARRVDADFEADFDDILDDTNIAFMAILEARRDAWSIVVDSLFAEVEDDDSRVDSIRVESRTRQTVIDAKLGYRIWEGPGRLALEVLGGARYVRNRNEIEARVAQVGRDVDETFDWVDAVVGVRVRSELTETLSFSLNGDVGGFGIGSSSDFTWCALGALTWQPWQRWSLSLGYKVLDIDRDKLDIQQHGPALGATYRF